MPAGKQWELFLKSRWGGNSERPYLVQGWSCKQRKPDHVCAGGIKKKKKKLQEENLVCRGTVN